jgi:siderophore synthetase component
MAMDNAYISQRIINTCIRENVCEIISKGSVIDANSLVVGGQWPHEIPTHWLKISHLDNDIFYVAIAESHYMQSWQAPYSGWLRETQHSVVYEHGFKDWLNVLANNLGEEEKQFFYHYITEAECAVEHRKLAQIAYKNRLSQVMRPLADLTTWHEQLLFSDQVASYLDHPYYPTARAKSGFDLEALKSYAPEFSRPFALNWVAIDKKIVTLTSETPECWPQFYEVGLDSSLQKTHQLFPVHPLTCPTLDFTLAGIVLAPLKALEVTATLSVRTVVVLSSPEIHIKLPLIMATLGARNVRLIKPSTLYDGDCFEQILTGLAKHDAKLYGLYDHCDEQHGGHMGGSRELAYIVRKYPQSMHDKYLVPVAAFGSEMPDGRIYLAHLIDHFYAGDVQVWLDQYLTLLLSVHLRLWLKYGIALESNQQNAVIAFSHQQPLTLIMKDNDSARLLAERYINNALGQHAQIKTEQLIDPRILVDNEQALADMFTTITLQLDIAAIFEAMANYYMMSIEQLYKQLRETLQHQLNLLDEEDIATQFARDYLLAAEFQPAKYLLSSGSLLSKHASGAADINKFYGRSVPNFLRADFQVKSA